MMIKIKSYVNNIILFFVTFLLTFIVASDDSATRIASADTPIVVPIDGGRDGPCAGGCGDSG